MKRLIAVFACTLIFASGTGYAAPGEISTFAGNGISGDEGDGGPAARASLLGPTGLDRAADGSIFIADTYNHRIRKVSPSGVISRVAGTESGFAGDGGPALDAAFRYPEGVAVASDGTVFVSDTGNDRVRKISPAGVVTTIAGTGGAISQSCLATNIEATRACLDEPAGIALDNDGSLLVADRNLDRVVRITPQGVLQTIAGTPWARGYWGDGGPPIASWLALPTDVSVGGGGILIADTGNHRIRRLAGGIITTVAGNGTGYLDEHPVEYLEAGPFTGGKEEGKVAVDASVQSPEGVLALSDGSFFVSSAAHERVYRIDAAGILRTVAGRGYCSPGSLPFVEQPDAFVGDGGPATDACLSGPAGLELDAAGALLIAEFFNSRVRRVEGPFA